MIWHLWVQGILSQCRDPQAAFHNWMGRDIEFGGRVARQVRNQG
jgi:hypothetical protein